MTRLAQAAGGRGAGFGTSISADGNEIWVSAPRAGGAGGVFVFTHDGPTFPVEGAKFSRRRRSRRRPRLGRRSACATASPRSARPALNRRRRRRVHLRARRHPARGTSSRCITPALDELPALTGDERRCNEPGQGRDVRLRRGRTCTAFLPPSKLTPRRPLHPDERASGAGPIRADEARSGRSSAVATARRSSTSRNPTQAGALADLPLTDGARPAAWREIKIYKDHAFIVSDGAGQHGMQVFDLTRLRTMKPQPNGQPQKVECRLSSTASQQRPRHRHQRGQRLRLRGGIERRRHDLRRRPAHDRHPRAEACRSSSAASPTPRPAAPAPATRTTPSASPTKARTSATRATRSASARTRPRSAIADVTDKKAPKALSRAGYPKVGYTHQGWFTDDHKYFYVDDERDETAGTGREDAHADLGFHRSRESEARRRSTWASRPRPITTSTSIGDYMYQANYESGLRILNIKDPREPARGRATSTPRRTARTRPGFQRRVERVSVLQERRRSSSAASSRGCSWCGRATGRSSGRRTRASRFGRLVAAAIIVAAGTALTTAQTADPALRLRPGRREDRGRRHGEGGGRHGRSI